MENISTSKKVALAIQHVLAMFGATVLVPALTGLSPSIALLSAGIGTLIFHLVTKKIVPVFLGSSFAFIGAITLVLDLQGIASVKSGVICAGLVYVIMSYVIKMVGVEKVKAVFPPIVTGPIIIIIGLRLSPTALAMSGYSIDSSGLGHFDSTALIISFCVVITMILLTVFAKGFLKLLPILISVIVGYVLSMAFGIVDYTAIQNAPFFGLDAKSFADLTTLPVFDLSSILTIAPIAVVVFIEHIGDITTNGAVVGKDFFKNPGIHRTMLGDGLATIMAGFLGAPPNTTYSENTGVLAVTKVYDPQILRLSAVFAIIISLLGKFSGLIQSIPAPVMGGVSLILFGMIASVGLRTLVDAKIDFSKSRNLIIASLILILGIGIDNVDITGSVSMSGLAISAFIGIILNLIIPNVEE